MENVPTPIDAGTEMGAGSRLLNVYFSPAKVFESIARKRGWDWLVPMLLLVALSVAGAMVVAPKLDIDDAVRVQMQKMDKIRPGMNDTERGKIEEAVRAQLTSMTRGSLRFIGPLFVVIPMFLVPLFYHGIAAAWGKSTSYMAVVAGYAYVQMVQAVKGVLMLAVAAPRKSIGLLEVGTLLKSNLGALLDPETASRPLLTLASNVDVFEIWAIALGTIALSRITRLTVKGAALTVVGLWTAWLLVQLAGALIGSAFGG